MYGGSGKLGRGRGGGVPVKRTIHSTFQPSSVQRPSANPVGGRLSGGGGNRNRNNISASASAALDSSADESFSLVRNSPLNFGMIIRLTPNLIEEIKRVEAQGVAAKIKFDSCANIPDGNVINVGGKEFRFTWSQETGDLCDIYEEHESGDKGDGLLVEAGGAWRRVNVHRELDASFTNHVKMRTVEADPKHKSRKAIVLDHGNPSMKNQMKALAAAEVNSSWKGSFKQKKEPPFKKMKAEPSSAIVPPKSDGKAGFSSSTPSKIRASASPLLSIPEQSGVPVSPLKNRNVTKINTNREDFTSNQSCKENASTSVKEMLSRVRAGVLQNKPGSNERFGTKPTDLQSLLISLLMEKPQGMNLKALEKAVGETFPKYVKQIEPILKKIAVCQAQGRYILKPEVDLESSKKTLSESGSSPENNNHDREATTPELRFALKPDDVKEFEQPSHLISKPYEVINTSEKIDIDHFLSDLLSEKKVSENIELPAVSSSASGSDSDSGSDSSDSGSDSRSSDSESDASSNSKQGSDEDVDIMSDDDNEHKQTVQQSDHEAAYAHNNTVDGHGSDLLDLEKDLFGDDIEGDIHVVNKDVDNYADETTNLFNKHFDHQDIEVRDHARKTVSKSTSIRGSDEKHFDGNEHAKRLNSGNGARPDGPSEGPYKGITNQMMGRMVRDVSDYDYEKPDNRDFFVNSPSDSPKSGQRSIDLNAHAKPPSERGPQGNDLFFTQKDKANEETRNEDGHSKDRRPPKNSRGKHSGSHQKKHGTSIEKIKDSGVVSASQFLDSPIDFKKSPLINVTNGRGLTLQRELSDLEMGELRENLHEEASGGKKCFERNNLFKQIDNKSSSDYWNLDESKGNTAGRTSLDSAKPSPLKKVVSDDHFDDFSRFNGKPVSRLDPVKGGLHHSKGRDNESGASQGFGSEKTHVGPPHKHEKQVVPIITKDKKRHKSKDLGEKKKDFWVVDKRKEMESDDSIISYIKYEKDEPEKKGPIRDLSQYNEYVQEYREKYDCYNMLNKILETYRNKFQTFGRDLELAKGKDNDRYNKILEQLMESYRQCGMKHKRLKKIFVVLHHELQHLKEMIRDFAEKQTKG